MEINCNFMSKTISQMGLIFVLLTFANNKTFAQDIIKSILVRSVEIVDLNFYNLVEEFIDQEYECLGKEKNTIVIMNLERKSDSDTNVIILRVIHSRDLDFESTFGLIQLKGVNIYCDISLENVSFLKADISNMIEVHLSQRITFSNYLIKDSDTLFLLGPWPYEAFWVLLQSNSHFNVNKDLSSPCTFSSSQLYLKELIELEGWEYP